MCDVILLQDHPFIQKSVIQAIRAERSNIVFAECGTQGLPTLPLQYRQFSKRDEVFFESNNVFLLHVILLSGAENGSAKVGHGSGGIVLLFGM